MWGLTTGVWGGAPQTHRCVSGPDMQHYGSQDPGVEQETVFRIKGHCSFHTFNYLMNIYIEKKSS